MATKKIYEYKVGKQSASQEQLNNNLSGTEANSIYYATHGGTGASPVYNANTPQKKTGNYVKQSTVSYNPSNYTSIRDSRAGSTGNSRSGYSYSDNYGYNGYNNSYDAGDTYDYAGMIQEIMDRQAAQAAEAEAARQAALEEQRAAARAAYDASVGRLNDSWENTKNALAGNLDSTRESLQRQYDYGAGVANRDAEQAMKEAYINYMMNRKNLNQSLSAQGLSGGATESSLARMYNNYGSSRNNIDTTRQNNIADLLNAYQNNLSSAQQAYNSQYADALANYNANLNNMEQMLANNLMASYSGSPLTNTTDYSSTLAALINGMEKQASRLAENKNTYGVNSVSTSQRSGGNSNSNYAAYQQMLENMAQNGASNAAIIQQLKNSGASLNDIYKLMGAA